MEEKLLNDLAIELPNGTRLHRATKEIRKELNCDAVAILMLDTNKTLHLIAADGLAQQALGRQFKVSEHPRFAKILQHDQALWFSRDNQLPDPFDGLMANQNLLPHMVHDCIGMPLYCQGKLWGLISIDSALEKNFTATSLAKVNRIGLILQVAAHVKRLEQENRQLRLLNSSDYIDLASQDVEKIIGQSQSIQALLIETDLVADSDLPILLLGETGVGKDLFARRIHRNSKRKDKPLIQVNCAALPEALAESELFGHVKGAFSGATNDRLGRFEAAQGGTLFLDEIGELPLSLQAKLLRVLQNGEIQRLGTDKSIKTDVRIIAATNRDLKANTLAGTFRADLYHRLSVYPIAIPALRNRGNDILILAGHFLELSRVRFGLRGLRLSHQGQQAMLSYPWPGNVRELEHIINRAALKMLSRKANRDQIITIDVDLLDLEWGDQNTNPFNNGAEINNQLKLNTINEPAKLTNNDSAHDDHAADNEKIISLKEIVANSQKQAIKNALQNCQGSWAQAARALQIDASNLHKLAKKLDLKN